MSPEPGIFVVEGFTASCALCGESKEYDTQELAKMAAVEHVFRVHRSIYYEVVCGAGTHGALCDGRH